VTVVVALLLAVFVLPYPWGVVAVGASIVIEIGEAWFWIWLSRRRRPVVGAEALVGATGTVVTACSPRGQIRLNGELWDAVASESPLVAGERVRVVGRDALTLLVVAETR
jgi:membrane-bound ClpP family serine protease